MFLQSLEFKNYRRFTEIDGNKIEMQYEENGGVKNTSLFIGKNNSGKTSVIEFLEKLSKSRSFSSSSFEISDINHGVLKKIFDEVISGNINSSKLEVPSFEANLVVSIINQKDKNMWNVYKFLYVDDFNLNSNLEYDEDLDKGLALNIKLKYEPKSHKVYATNIDNFRTDNYARIQEIISHSGKNTNENKYSGDKTEGTYSDNIEFTLNSYLLYEEFLNVLKSSNYCLKVYSKNGLEVTDFDFSDLFNTKVVKANIITNENSLTNAYNSILTNIIKGDHEALSDVNKKIYEMQNTMFNLFDTPLLEINKAARSIENPQNLNIQILPNISTEVILKSASKYAYLEDGKIVFEKQYGLGYTNLMLIISNITEFMNIYRQARKKDKINLILIEEPETFMHPQMQENFMNYIANAVSILSGENSSYNFQLVVSTHSSNIVNSKLHHSKSFDNINFFKGNYRNYNESKIITLNSKSFLNVNHDELTYIRKHVQLEMTELFFADAVILVEGITEELYIKNMILNDPNNELSPYLDKMHIKVYRLNGAHGLVHQSLLKAMGIPSVILTDMDYKCTRSTINNQIKEDFFYQYIDQCNSKLDLSIFSKLTTNATLITNFKNEVVKESNYFNIYRHREWFRLNSSNNPAVLTQGLINGYYATSFEEALILENLKSNNISNSDILNVLEKCMPVIYSCLIEDLHASEPSYSKFPSKGIENISKKVQNKFSSSRKTKFIEQIIYSERNTSKKIYTPAYILESFKVLERKIKGNIND